MRRRNYYRKNYNRYRPRMPFFNRVVYRPQVNIDISDDVIQALQFVIARGVLPITFQCECGEVNQFLLLFTNEVEYINTVIKYGYKYADMKDEIACAKCGKVHNFSETRKVINIAYNLLNR